MKNSSFSKMNVLQKISKTVLLFIILCFSIFSFGQSTEPNITDKKNQPDVQINVNRELDNNGNVIRYDSTYSWSWSSDGSQPIPQNFMNDSNQANFFRFFDNQDFSGSPFDNNIDSIFSQHFNNSYFEDFEKQMQEMMQRQQQLMNEFFGQPPIVPAPEEKKDNDTQQKAPPKKTSGTGIDI